MKKNTYLNTVLTVLMILMLVNCNREDKLRYVDPTIGNVGHILEPTRPLVHLPNEFIRVYPNRKDHMDDQITSFPLTLISHRNGQLFNLMPVTSSYNGPETIIASWDQSNEVTKPHYYSVVLNHETLLEFVPSKKTGLFRITFPADKKKKLLLSVVNDGYWTSLSNNSVAGEEIFSGMKAFVYAEFNKAFAIDTNAGGRNLIISWDSLPELTVEFRYGISLISIEQAMKNFKNEIDSVEFGVIKDQAKEAWEKVLNRISVKGGTESQKRTFYTALYRCHERMVDITEDGMYYSNYDGKIHETSRRFFVDDWAWDTYLTHHPLRCIIDPQMEADMIDSYISMYEQSGWLPTFPILWGDVPCMNGFHSTIMILDAYNKGIRNYNLEKAYEGMKKNATEATMLPWQNGKACNLDTFYYINGFYPALAPGEKETEPRVDDFEKRQAVALTLGHSYDDWALSRVADYLGRAEDKQLFEARSANYRNLYHPEKHFFLPKNEHGEWIHIDPEFDGGMGGRDYYDENNGWTYLWQVQHDIPDLIELMGGEEAFIGRLDQLFRQGLGRSKYELWARFPDFTGITGQFSMGNEPSFHIPYLYNFTSAPWKTQRRIRSLLSNWFPDNIFGIPGDEDGGGMSAFVVFSSMGIYPVIPGLPLYTIGSPVFNEVTITLPEQDHPERSHSVQSHPERSHSVQSHPERSRRVFRIVAKDNSEKNVYIQQAYLNGKLLEGPWITHDDLIKGGELRLEMGPMPVKSWGNPDVFKKLLESVKN